MHAAPALERDTTRETFADAQGRHRRAERAAFAACLTAVVVVGLPLAVVVSPLVIAVVVLATDVLNLAVPVPDLGGLAAHHLLGLGGTGEVTGVMALAPGVVRAAWAVLGLVALLAPGVGLMVAAWLGVRRLALRSGADALILATGARPPRPGDLVERRLANLVEEMAIAAGVPRPRVMVVEGDVANAAVVGTSVDDATIVVPRGLLDALGRDATGAVVADLLAMARAGDLGLAVTVASVLQTFDLVGAALAAPTNRRTRRALWRFARLAARSHRAGAEGAAQVEEEARFLAGELAALGRGEAAPEPARGLLMGLVQLPFLVASLAFTLLRLGPGALLVDPALATLWRRRRLLADATAVELTRDPGALARALAHLESAHGPAPAGPWAHLFVVPPDPPDRNVLNGEARERPEPHDIRSYEDGGYPRDWMRRPTAVGRVRLAAAGWAARLAEGRWAGAPARRGRTAEAELVTFVPPLGERLDRLHAMGAHPDLDALGRPAPQASATATARATHTTRVTLTWSARVTGAAAALAAGLALVYVTLVIDALVLAPPTVLLHAVLR
jgi:Zn-dependent protease with chaperone function